jgi:pyruvate/2-oxoglutarate dehydrogenase complex dihydrolipoamide acyltransferase (E2) component
MSHVVLDPELWEAVEAGAMAFIERWLVSEGDHVQTGQVLARATLLHSTVDVPTAHAGVVEEILVAAGETFAPGAVLARVAAT